MTNREALRATFDTEADRYDRIRPRYPGALIDELLALCALSPGDPVLEIGCGTGQLSVPLASHGLAVHAVELGAGLANVAARNLSDFPSCRVDVADFDTWRPTEQYAAVVTATAFHWLDPATRFARVAAALRSHGALAIVSTHHVAGGTEDFFVNVQEHYLRHDPTTVPGHRLPAADAVTADSQWRTSTPEPGEEWYSAPEYRRYAWDRSYTTADFLDTLRTYSSTIAMAPANRAELLGAIGNLIDSRYGGRVVKRYQNELRVTRLVAESAPGGQ